MATAQYGSYQASGTLMPIPQENKPHKLQGIYEGCLECHIEDDFLLIWIDEATDIVKLLRLGTRHELSGK